METSFTESYCRYLRQEFDETMSVFQRRQNLQTATQHFGHNSNNHLNNSRSQLSNSNMSDCSK